jgi:glycosyltransferase involved in cell wall biosynthesis
VTADGGATELLSGTQSYTYWNRRTILAAVADSLAADAPRLRAGLPERPNLALPPLPTRTGLEKLVSVVIATRDRPAMLDTTLGTIDRQTYPAVEVVVVNDAGTDVSAIAASHKRARVLATQGRLGPGGARNVGLRSVRGEYVTFFDDDDEMFPDHIASLVHALERTNLDVAYGQMLNGFFLRAGADRYVLDGVSPHEALLDHAEIQWAGSMATTSVLFRRRLVEEIGEVDGGLATAEDYDFWYRLAQGREWARVPYVTALYRWRLDGSNYSALSCDRFVIAHRQIYLKHPTNRTLVAAGRQAFLDGLTEGAARDRARMKNIARIG